MDDINLSKNYLLQVTNELYRITLLFPKKEPLRYTMRQLSNNVLANFVDLSKEISVQEKARVIEDTNNKIEVLDGFFNVARAQNWVRPSDVLGLQGEYDEIRRGFASISINKKEQEIVQVAVHVPVNIPVPVVEELHREIPKPKEVILSSRQEKILKILDGKDKTQVNDVKDYFPDTSKRTLRRDLKGLLDYDLIKRKGERNSTFYEIRDA